MCIYRYICVYIDIYIYGYICVYVDIWIDMCIFECAIMEIIYVDSL